MAVTCRDERVVGLHGNSDGKYAVALKNAHRKEDVCSINVRMKSNGPDSRSLQPFILSTQNMPPPSDTPSYLRLPGGRDHCDVSRAAEAIAYGRRRETINWQVARCGDGRYLNSRK